MEDNQNTNQTVGNSLQAPSPVQPIVPQVPINQLPTNTPPSNKGKKIILIACAMLLLIAAAVGGYLLLARSKKEDPKSNDAQVTSNESSQLSIENGCFSLSYPSSKFPDVSPDTIKMTDTSGSGSCKFIVQFEGMGDTPIAVGELFSGNYTWDEKRNLIPEALKGGFELDLLDLGLLRTGKGEPMSVTEEIEGNIGGQRAVLFTHLSNRSISRQAHSAVIEAPSSMTIAGQPASALFVWGAANQMNQDIMEKMLETLTWK